MIVCIKRKDTIKLVEIDEIGFDTGIVKFAKEAWDEVERIDTKNPSDTVVLVFDAGELIMRIDENGAKLPQGNLITTKGAD